MRQSRRESHTRVGWWIMSHERGGPAVLGASAAVVLIADLLYAVSHWTGSFPRAFLAAIAALAAVAIIALAVSLLPTIGSGRRALRWNQRAINVVFVVVIAISITVNNRVGGDWVGEMLGAVAGLTGGFTLYTAIWLARKRTTSLAGP